MSKNNLVYCIHPNQYDIFDERINKPVWFRKIENGAETGSMVLQEMDEINFTKNPFEFFAPNNVGILLSVCQQYRDLAKDLYNKKINPKNLNHSLVNTTLNQKEFLQRQSKLAADYIELIQIAIVFSYTAIEAFANLSVPENYAYHLKVKNKGITEIYDKEAIERWVSLTDKLSNILTEVYKRPKSNQKNFGAISNH